MGIWKAATIVNFFWEDLDRDGIQDAGEPGVADVTVTLQTPTGILTTTTDANGLYLFTDVIPGDYFIKFAPPPGLTQQYKISPPDQGSSDLQDSDVNQQTLQTPVTTLVAGEDDRSWDMGVYLVGTKLDDEDEPLRTFIYLPLVSSK